jgi:2-methylcitrate dehydratase PrpD
VAAVDTITGRLAAWVAGLTAADIPEHIRDVATSQVLAHIGALAAGAGHELGGRVLGAFGPPFRGDPEQTAYVSAALTMLLDFDDTMYAGHVSHSSVGVPLAYAEPLRLDGPSLLTAVVAANETAARVTAAATLGPHRGQTAAHTHLVGAVAGRGSAEGAAARQLVDAWGIALTMPPWILERGFFGSDAKALTAATPVRIALDAYAAAAAGLHGAADILEHRDGFLARFATLPLPEAAGQLGDLWHTETLSIKLHPGCAYIDGAVEAAIALHPQVADRIDQIERVMVEAPIFTVGMEAHSAPHLDGPRSGVAAITFSIPYNVATALMRGSLKPGDLSSAAIADERTWGLARRIELREAHDLSVRAVLATSPVGAALRLAGAPAAAWLAALLGGDPSIYAAQLARGPDASFEHAEKAMGARLTVAMSTGEELTAAVDIPSGFAGPELRRRHREFARGKFLQAAEPWMGDDAASEACRLLEGLPSAGRDDVARLCLLLRDAFSRQPEGRRGALPEPPPG